MPNAHFKNENNALAAQRSSTLTYCLQRPALMPFQRSRKSRNQIMPGVFALTRSGDICVHSYTAPEAGWLVNTHIIETGTQLLVVDAQYTLDYAREVVAYAATLGKPIARLYVTHYHPDHILGAAAIPASIHALEEVARKIEAVGDRVAGEEHEKMGSAIPIHAERVRHIVAPGLETIDGVRLEFIQVKHAETEDALLIGLPEHGILITQDVVYNGVHVFIGEHAFDGWTAALDYCQKLPYDKILPGHGAPGGPELYEAMRTYLDAARSALAQAADGPDLRARLIEIFPDHRGRVLLEHQMRFLFKPAA
jgi:glyoxylase-like metal-dependent hydrolase (beta-lactamase superfamily II)